MSDYKVPQEEKKINLARRLRSGFLLAQKTLKDGRAVLVASCAVYQRNPETGQLRRLDKRKLSKHERKSEKRARRLERDEADQQ